MNGKNEKLLFKLGAFLIYLTLLINVSYATDSLSYSGRLVKSNGVPVAGPVDLKVELSYTDFPNNILCSQDFSGVVLTNGVFHLKLDLNCGSNGSLVEVLSLIPSNQSAAVRVTDMTNTKTYSFQALHSMPFANISDTAKQLVQMGALPDQVLKWNNTLKKWEPGSVGGIGTVTNVTATLPLSVTGGASTPAISISQASTSTNGYLSATDWNTFNNKQPLIASGVASQYYRGDKTWQTLDTSVVPENINLYFTNARALGVPLTGFTTATGAIVATDSILAAFGKTQGQLNSLNSAGPNYLIKNSTDSITGLVNVGTTGLLQLIYAPVGMNDATNKAYVDSTTGLKVSKTGDTMSGDLTLNSDLKIKGGSNYVTIKAHASSANYDLTLPSSGGAAGYVLSTDGSGNTSWLNLASLTTGAGTVNSASIVDGSIVDADINASADIAQSKIHNLMTDLATINTSIVGLLAKGQWEKTGSDVYYSAGDVRIDNHLKFKDSASNYVLIKAPSTVTTNYTLTLPQVKASATGQALISDTSGILSWATVTDASVQAFAKSALPTCNAGEVLKSNGTAFTCVTDNAGAGAFSGTASRAVVTDGAGALTTSTITSTELGYVSGVTSSIQTQFNNILNRTLTGLSIATNSAITAADSILVAFGKLQAQITGQTTTLSSKADQTNVTQTITAATVTGLSLPLTTSDAANKGYVDQLISSSNSIQKVRVATTVDIILSGTQTVDAVNLNVGDRVLVKNQTNNNDNGVYVVAAGAWTRASDLDTWSEAVGYHVHVDEGNSWEGMDLISGAQVSGTFGTSGYDWMAFGNSLISENTVSGYQALDWNTTGYQNVATGHYALTTNTTGGRNVASGYNSLLANNTGNHNTATGYSALRNNVNGNENTATGSSSLRNNTSGVQNTAFGTFALNGVTSGNSNIGIGYNAGSAITTGSNNVLIGSNTGSTIATSSNNIFIADGSGNLRMQVNSSGDLGIGVAATGGAKLQVAGQVKITGGTPGAGKVLTSDATGLATWTTLAVGAPAYSGTASRAVATDGAGALTTSSTTSTELGYVSGVTSSIQTQFNNILNRALTGLSTATNSAITAADSILIAFGKLQAQITGQNTSLSGKADQTNVTQTITTMTVTGLTGPVAGADATNKTYVDAQIASAANQWTEGGGNVYRSSGNVGIGTTSPGAMLEVAGQVKITGGSPGAGKVLTSDTDGLATWETAGAGSINGSGTATYIPKFNASGTITNSSILEDATGKVGIGGTPMNYRLEVIHNLNNTHGIWVRNSSTGTSAGSHIALGIGATNVGGNLSVSGSGAPADMANRLAVYTQPGATGISIAARNAAQDIRFYTGGTIERARIDATGNVGIGVTTPGYKLDVAGDINITGTPYRAGGDIAWTVPSDERLKDITNKYTRGLSEITKLSTIKFRYKNDNPKGIDSSKEYTGVIAQEVQKQIPEAIKKDKDGFLSLNTTPIFWAMINAFKELNSAFKADSEKLKLANAKIKNLEDENDKMKARLERIEIAFKSK
jgi:ribosomal protein S6E (S10)